MKTKIIISTIMLISPIFATGRLSYISLDDPVYYHKETVIMSPCKQFGGLYIQWPDEPFSLAKRYVARITDAPKQPTRSLMARKIHQEIPTSPVSVFAFLQATNTRDKLRDLIKW